MRILLVLTCCLGLVLFAGAAQQDDQNNNKGKKKGGNNAPTQQTVAPYSGKQKFKPQHQYAPNQTYVPNQTHVNKSFKKTTTTGGNLSSTANSTTFNKSKTINKNITVNKNFKVQKFNLPKQPNAKYQAVKFNQNYKIAGAQNWKGAKYQVFVNYQPQWHDQWWWQSHHTNIVFVFGSPYYWDTGYWYPAWGYNPGATFYFDGPIYASSPEYDPGQVVANVQSALQQQGYYQGEIDGVLGPQTRAALAEYQSAQDLEPTGAVDEPTLERLGIA
jgi:hypothetical protein